MHSFLHGSVMQIYVEMRIIKKSSINAEKYRIPLITWVKIHYNVKSDVSFNSSVFPFLFISFKKWMIVTPEVVQVNSVHTIFGALSTVKTWTCWSRSREWPQKCSEGWNTSPVRKGLDSWGCSAWRREGSRDASLCPFSTWRGAYKKAGERLFQRACSDRTRGNGFKIKDCRFRLGIRKKFFPMRVARHRKRLSRGAVDAPSLEVFKARLYGALSSLV